MPDQDQAAHAFEVPAPVPSTPLIPLSSPFNARDRADPELAFDCVRVLAAAPLPWNVDRVEPERDSVPEPARMLSEGSELERAALFDAELPKVDLSKLTADEAESGPRTLLDRASLLREATLMELLGFE